VLAPLVRRTHSNSNYHIAIALIARYHLQVVALYILQTQPLSKSAMPKLTFAYAFYSRVTKCVIFVIYFFSLGGLRSEPIVGSHVTTIGGLEEHALGFCVV
jgi:hypothetical protein